MVLCLWDEMAGSSRNIQHHEAQEVEAGDKVGNYGHLERCFYNSGRSLYQQLFRAIFGGMKLTQRSYDM